jgi:hypothetical protein
MNAQEYHIKINEASIGRMGSSTYKIYALMLSETKLCILGFIA